MSIKIIGAGFPRTGTNTLRESLQMLGYIKTYHMKELLVHPDNLPFWQTLKKTGTTNWEQLYSGYEATVDFPCYPWYKEHMKQYPDAKVILSIRPFENWYSSVHSTIWKAQNPTDEQREEMGKRLQGDVRLQSVMKVMDFAKETIMNDHFGGRFLDKEYVEKIFYKHNEDVKKFVPANKLLMFDVCEGWGPLCKFLGVDEPVEALPHTNKREDFSEMIAHLMSGEMV